jgi:hypothetical protein
MSVYRMYFSAGSLDEVSDISLQLKGLLNGVASLYIVLLCKIGNAECRKQNYCYW